MAELITAGGFPAMTYLWQSTSHNGRVSSCRGGIVRLSLNVPISIRLNRGVAYSDAQRQTTWSMFDTALVALSRSLLYVLYEESFSVVNQPVSTCYLVQCTVHRVLVDNFNTDRNTSTLFPANNIPKVMQNYTRERVYSHKTCRQPEGLIPSMLVPVIQLIVVNSIQTYKNKN